MVEKIYFLRSPGIPWNLDVTLLALVYIGIGFFYRKHINYLLKAKSVKCDVAACAIAVGLKLFCWFIFRDGNRHYYFDMKPIYYKDFAFAISIPCAFGVSLARLIHHMMKIRWINVVQRFFILCGQASLPIMFMHIPLNHWKNHLGYNRLIYMLIGIGIPLIVTVLFNRISALRKILGLPNIRE